jgi:hypothetical protein
MADPFEQLWGPSPSANPGPLTSLLRPNQGAALGLRPGQEADLSTFDAPGGAKFTVARKVAPQFQGFLNELAGSGYSINPQASGGYNNRNIAGSNRPSQHAFGNAIDLNWDQNPRGTAKSNLPPNVGDIAAKYGLTWGGTWKNPDPMHFEASQIMGGQPAAPTQTEKPMPMPYQDDPQRPQQQPLAGAMGGNSFVPGIMGGGDQPGYFGKLLADPTFLMGASVLGAGLSGRDAGSALATGAQGAAAVSEMTEKRRRAQAWQKIMGNGTPDPNSPILKGIPPEVLPIIHAMGPEQGMQVLGQIAMKKMSPHQLTTVAPGASLYDEQAGKVAYTAPDASKLPTGYQAGPDAGSLAYIPGGPADPALKVKEVQYSEGASRAANFGNMMAEAEKSLEGMAKKGPDGKPLALENPNGLGGTLRESMMPDSVANPLRSSEYQNYRQSAMQWVRAKLRKESGAAISNGEFEGEFQTYFPQYGDGPDVIKQKQLARQQAQEGMIAESRGAYNQLFGAKRAPGVGVAPGAAPAAQPQAPAAPPQPGQVEDGYRFKGGNPADPNSWERMQ